MALAVPGSPQRRASIFKRGVTTTLHGPNDLSTEIALGQRETLAEEVKEACRKLGVQSDGPLEESFLFTVGSGAAAVIVTKAELSRYLEKGKIHLRKVPEVATCLVAALEASSETAREKAYLQLLNAAKNEYLLDEVISKRNGLQVALREVQATQCSKRPPLAAACAMLNDDNAEDWLDERQDCKELGIGLFRHLLVSIFAEDAADTSIRHLCLSLVISLLQKLPSLAEVVNQVLTSSSDRTARLWDMKTGSCERVLSHNGPVVSASFSPTGQVLTASSDRTARLWSSEGDALQKLSGHSQALHSACFSPKGEQVLTASHDGTARLWNLDGECVQVFRGHTAHVYQATFSSDGQKVVTCSADDSALVFDVTNGECLQRLTGHASAVYQAVFSPDDSKVLTAAADTFAGLFEVSTGSFLKYFAEHRLAVHSVAFSGDGSKVLTAGDDRAVRIFNTATGDCLRCFEGHGEHVYVAVFSPSFRKVLTGSEDCTAKIFDL